MDNKKIKKGSMILLKKKYGFNHVRARVIEIYKDTLQVLIYGYHKNKDIRLIFFDDVLRVSKEK